MFCTGHKHFGRELNHILGDNSLGGQVVVVLQGHVSGAEVPVGWAVVFLEGGVLLSCFLRILCEPFEVHVREHAVVGDPVVPWCGLEVVQVREGGRVGVTEEKGHELVSIINSVQFLSIKILLDIVLDNWVLGNSSLLSSSGIKSNSISERENILKLFMLKSIFIDINSSISFSNSSGNKLGMRV